LQAKSKSPNLDSKDLYLDKTDRSRLWKGKYSPN